MTKPASGPIGSLGHWNTPRPLDAAVKDHIHGAIDIVAPMGTPILAPVRGTLYGWMLWRPEGRTDAWVKQVDMPFPWGAYSYDVYGGCLILQDLQTKQVHLFAHLYMNQLLRYSRFHPSIWSYVEEDAQVRWPMFMWHSLSYGLVVDEGELIGVVGNAGMSRGPHLHWEIHNGWEWTPYEKRPDPETLVKGD